MRGNPRTLEATMLKSERRGGGSENVDDGATVLYKKEKIILWREALNSSSDSKKL